MLSHGYRVIEYIRYDKMSLKIIQGYILSQLQHWIFYKLYFSSTIGHNV